MDGRVIDVPYVIRKLIVSGFILPFRPMRSAEAYRTIWWDEGSPLVVVGRRVQKLLDALVEAPVELAMRYGNPSIEEGIRALAERAPDLESIRVVPLYPHYAMSTVESTVVEVENKMREFDSRLDLRVVKPFYGDSLYVSALAESAREYLEKEYDHLLVSYHGLPERHLRKTDPTGNHCLTAGSCCETPSPAHDACYRHQVLRTTELLVERLEVPATKYTVSFQSRLGRDAWLEPFTAAEAVRLAGSGVKRLLVICPAFVADCLETLEEVGHGVREQFLGAGGESFEMIPCLNDHPVWIEALRRYCTEESYAA
jgi:ferrochelatase